MEKAIINEHDSFYTAHLVCANTDVQRFALDNGHCVGVIESGTQKQDLAFVLCQQLWKKNHV